MCSPIDCWDHKGILATSVGDPDPDQIRSGPFRPGPDPYPELLQPDPDPATILDPDPTFLGGIWLNWILNILEKELFIFYDEINSVYEIWWI